MFQHFLRYIRNEHWFLFVKHLRSRTNAQDSGTGFDGGSVRFSIEFKNMQTLSVPVQDVKIGSMKATSTEQNAAQAVQDGLDRRLLDHRTGDIEQRSIPPAQGYPGTVFSRHADHTSMARIKRPCGAISASPHVLVTRERICSPPIRECYHSACGCCDSSFCFSIARTRSSEERVLSTATLRTMLPFNPVSPACFDPLAVMR